MSPPKDPLKYQNWIKNLSEARKGRKFPKMSESKKQLFAEGKLKAWNKGIPHSEETKRKISLANIGKHAWNKGFKKERKINYDNCIKCQKQFVKKGKSQTHCSISCANSNRVLSEDWRHKISIALKGHKTTWKNKISESKKGVVFTDDHKRKISETKKKLFKENKLFLPMKNKNHTQESCRKISETRKLRYSLGLIKSYNNSSDMKELWKDKNYKELVLKAIVAGNNIKPNKPEKLLDSLIQSNFPNEYKLNVLADTILNGKIPDFVNINGQKKVILFNGIYWHLWRLQKKNPNLTKKEQEDKECVPYNELGYSVCFIWEDELNDTEKVLQKIKEFNER